MSRAVPVTDESVNEAGAILSAGGLVAFPTETVYGLGADATDDRAVARIFEAKRRPEFNPLIVHVPDTDAARIHANFDKRSQQLARRFWPGALTMVLARRETSDLSLLVSAGLNTVALRCPAHGVAQRLLAAAKRPVAAPSANRSGRISPTTARHVADDLGDAVDLILDGGPCPIGVESTIVDVTGEAALLLRPGGVTRAAIESEIGPLATPDDTAVRAPGMLASHYAPRAPLRLNAQDAAPGEVLLAFGPDAPVNAVTLSASGDLVEAAANLFAMLRDLDDAEPRAIAVMPVPEHGLGVAINDRLARAAAPRA